MRLRRVQPCNRVPFRRLRPGPGATGWAILLKLFPKPGAIERSRPVQRFAQLRDNAADQLAIAMVIVNAARKSRAIG